MKKFISLFILAAIAMSITFVSCKKDDDDDEKDESKLLTLFLEKTFPISEDIKFGKQFDQQLSSDTVNYKVLSRTDYPDAYNHLDSIRDAILGSDDLSYAGDFTWPIKIIDEDVLNAFCAPGGYMYYYTGLIKYLDNEAQFAGVMAHEMAHADKRHVTKTLYTEMAASFLINAVLGKEPSEMEKLVGEYAKGLGVLKFSRKHEYEADEMAIKYTEDTEYYPLGIAGFFEKLQAEEKSGIRTPEFLSTHPNPGNRLEAMDSVYVSIGSPEGEEFEARYMQLKSYLP
ncbi:M48 family metalloprotease [Bacteroidota bacterium]